MTVIYSNFEKQITIQLDLETCNKALRLLAWLETYHEDIYWDIEMHETGEYGISISPEEIHFSGDNGIFILEKSNIVTI